MNSIFVKFDSWGCPPSTERKYQTNIPSGGECTLSRNAEARVVPVRLLVDDDVGDWFFLREIRVGIEPLLTTAGDLSMQVFRRREIPVKLRSLVWEVNESLSIVVKNESDRTQRFKCEIECALLATKGE